MINSLKQLDQRFIAYLQPRVYPFIRVSIGLIYLIFGFLKFLPNFSPAEDLAVQTIEMMTFGLFSGSLALYSLAIIETTIGLGLLLNLQRQWMIRLALWHMLCTFFPMILLPQATYTHAPYSLSIVGQYIIKNVIVIAALLALYIKRDSSQK